MMRKMLGVLLSKYKHTEFNLDENISFRYIVVFLLINLMKYARGLWQFRQPKKRILIGKHTDIYAKDKIIFSGKNVHIDKYCHIDALSREGIYFGKNISIQKYTIIECSGTLKHLGKGLVLGDNVGIGSNSFLGCAGGVEIGDDTIIGNYVSFHAENHYYEDLNIPIRLQGVYHRGIKIGKNCWIGAKVTILDGAIMEDGCVIAAGSVLTGKKYEKNSVIAGVPAKVIKRR